MRIFYNYLILQGFETFFRCGIFLAHSFLLNRHIAISSFAQSKPVERRRRRATGLRDGEIVLCPPGRQRILSMAAFLFGQKEELF